MSIQLDMNEGVDVPVLMFVFIRPDSLRKVFDVVRKARPTTLFLVSDGPRDGVPTDKERVAASRKVVENIDWECEVHRLYFDQNQGMYPMFKMLLEFVFSKVDRCIFLEDDNIPSLSFFKYCEVLLEKYKDDLRINNITGMNHLEVYGKPNADYFFSKAGSIWGFAFWKRTYDSFYDLSYGDDSYVMEMLMRKCKRNKHFRESVKSFYETGLHDGHEPGFEFFLGLNIWAQNTLNIVPTKNMIYNMGIGDGSTSNPHGIRLISKRLQKLFFMRTYELDFPLKHPKYVIEDDYYLAMVHCIMGRCWYIKFYRYFENIIRQLLYGNRKALIISVLRKIFLVNFFSKLLGGK